MRKSWPSPQLLKHAFLRRAVVIFTHVILWSLGFAGAYLLRFEGAVPPHILRTAALGLAVLLAIRVATFWASGLFHGILRYAGIPELKSIIRATSVGSIAYVGLAVLIKPLGLPRSIYVGEWILAIAIACTLRLGVRVIGERSTAKRKGARRALLVGAGDAGELFLRELERDPDADMQVVGILDDDVSKHDVSVRGVRVLGAVTEEVIRRTTDTREVDMVVLAIPSAPGSRTREIVAACQAAGLETKTLPGLQQILSGDVTVSALRDVAIEDLLRRDPIQLDEAMMDRFLRGRRVLVTGGAGSIGSELARQATAYEPTAIAVLDHNENSLFFLEREFSARHPQVDFKAFVADVKDPTRISELFREFRPHVVLHAAAHKHVPLMEANPVEAVKNNVFGTKVVADLANAHGVETFVLVSTDKAVRPRSIMGTSKRLAEMYVQSMTGGGRTRFVAVRFGNVLGSAGSVVEIFRKQIASGGPVTVTHPDMTRYFMTIPEACQLVLQAGAMAEGGEVFLLDMGSPVKIIDLATDMIKMSGYEPDVDIAIEISGTRPGEKMFEELLLDVEGSNRTVHSKIVVGNIRAASADEMHEAMAQLSEALDADPSTLRLVLSKLVPESDLEGLAPTENPDVREALNELGGFETLRPQGTAR